MDFTVSMLDITVIDRYSFDRLSKPTVHTPGFLVRYRVPILVYAMFLIGSVAVLHTPLPHDFEERHLMHFMDYGLQFAYMRPAKMMTWVGVSSATTMVFVRRVLDAAAKVLGPWTSDPNIHIYDTHIAGVSVRVYEPNGDRANDGMLVFVHGGGFVVGEVESYECLVRTITRQLRMVVISVEYRRAPEHVYPAAHDDVEAVMVALLTHAHSRFAVDPNRIVMAGDSAGGNLVAVTTQRLRALNQASPAMPKIKGQVLLYPLMQFHLFSLPSYVDYYKTLQGTSFLDPQLVVKAYLLYMGVHAEESSVQALLNGYGADLLHKFSHRLAHSHVSSNVINVTGAHSSEFAHLDALFDSPADYAPLLADDLTRLPPAFIATVQYDVLRSEGTLYAGALQDAGVDVNLVNYESGFHAMLNFYRHLPSAQRMIRETTNWILAVV